MRRESELVSVVIPVFERIGLAVEAVASVVAQQHVTTEIVVVDDGSSCDTTALRRLVEATGGQFLVQPHRGVAAARNAGIRAARGRWIAFLDSDDVFHPTKLARHIETLSETPDAVWSCCGFELVDGNGERLVVTTLHALEPEFWKTMCPFGATSIVAAREALLGIGGFDERFEVAEDWDLLLRLGNLSAPAVVHEALYAYRTGCSNMTAAGEDRWFAAWQQLVAKHGTRANLGAYLEVLDALPEINALPLRRAVTRAAAFRL